MIGDFSEVMATRSDELHRIIPIKVKKSSVRSKLIGQNMVSYDSPASFSTFPTALSHPCTDFGGQVGREYNLALRLVSQHVGSSELPLREETREDRSIPGRTIRLDELLAQDREKCSLFGPHNV